MTTSKNQTVGSVNNAFTIVESLAQSREMGVTELSSETGLHKSTVHSYLRTLEDLGYVINDNGRYRLSLRLFTNGCRVRNDFMVYRKGRSEVRELARETGELVNVGVLENDRVTILFIVEGDDAIQDSSKPGMELPVHTSALGKAMFAYVPEDRVDAIIDRQGLQKATQKTIADRDALFDELTVVREQGYAEDDEEWNTGLYCVAAPVLDGDEAPIGAVSISGPARPMKEDAYHESLANLVVNTANVIQVKIEYERE